MKKIRFFKRKNRKEERNKKTVKTVTYYYSPRKLCRNMARFNMEKQGVKHANSYFRWNWKNYVFSK